MNAPNQDRWYPKIALALIFLMVVLSVLFTIRDNRGSTDRWTMLMRRVEQSTPMFYLDLVPRSTGERNELRQLVRQLNAADAPLGVRARGIILARANGESAEHVQTLVPGIERSPTNFPAPLRDRVIRWLQNVYGKSDPIPDDAAAEYEVTIRDAHLQSVASIAAIQLAERRGNTAKVTQLTEAMRKEANAQFRRTLPVVSIFLLMFLSGIGVWIVFYVTRNERAASYTPAPLLDQQQASAVLWAVVAYLGLGLLERVVGLRLSSLGKQFSPTVTLGVVVFLQLLTELVAFLVLVWLLRKTQGNWRSLGFTSMPLRTVLLWGAGACVATYTVLFPTLTILQRILPGIPSSPHPAAEIASSNPSFWIMLLLFFSASIVAPIFEEIFFRSVLTGSFWTKTNNRTLAVGGAALIFAVLHPQLYLGWTAVFVIGVMLGSLFTERGNILMGMFAHAMNNTLAFLAAKYVFSESILLLV